MLHLVDYCRLLAFGSEAKQQATNPHLEQLTSLQTFQENNQRHNVSPSNGTQRFSIKENVHPAALQSTY